jgi:hypothetical protein
MFCSAYHEKKDDIAHTSNNWVSPDFQQRRIVPTHCAIRSSGDAPASSHVESRLVGTSVDGENWQEVAREEANRQLKDKLLTGTFEVAGGVECCLIRLVNIGSDYIVISVWEIFGSLFEEITNSSDVVVHLCFPPARRTGRSPGGTGAIAFPDVHPPRRMLETVRTRRSPPAAADFSFRLVSAV